MIRVGVIRGGIGNEYERSLETGAAVLNALRENHSLTYQPVDILITRDGVWHIGGRPITGEDLKNKIDVAWNALHGEYGEDGQVQTVLEELGIPYTGSGPVASALSINKKSAKDHIRNFDIKTTGEYVIADYRTTNINPEVHFKEEAQNVFLKFSPPWVIKPLNHASPVGVYIAKTRGELLDGIRNASQYPGEIMVEEYVRGKGASVVVADQFRGEPAYSFLPTEIRVSPLGQIEHVSPGSFASHEKAALQNAAKETYNALGLRHFAHIDFVISPKQIYVLEVSSSPSLAENSPLDQSLQSVGSNLSELVDHVIKLALSR